MSRNSDVLIDALKAMAHKQIDSGLAPKKTLSDEVVEHVESQHLIVEAAAETAREFFSYIERIADALEIIAEQ
jgi:hypothetical protein